MKMFLCLALLAANLAAAAPVPDYQPVIAAGAVDSLRCEWHDAQRKRDVPAKIYFPKDGAGPFPVIVFSHGLGGSREGYGYLGEYWAAHGYVSVHLQHHGSDEEILKHGALRQLEATMRKVISDPQNSIDRAADVSFAIDQLTTLNASQSPLHGRLDLARIGMAGHSFGAATTLLIAGEKAPIAGGTHADPRIKAAIAMSPPMFDQLVFDAVKVPVFVMTGTRDAGFTRTADRRTAYDKIDSPGTCLVNFDGADHMVFSGRLRRGDTSEDAKFHPLILAGTTAFWDAHLRGEASAESWLEQGGFAALLGNAGKFELKPSRK